MSIYTGSRMMVAFNHSVMACTVDEHAAQTAVQKTDYKHAMQELLHGLAIMH